MKKTSVLSFALCFSIFIVSAVLGMAFRDFDFEGRIGISILNLLIIFLVVTYVPLIYFYVKKKRARWN
jgi:hypothetical protein